MVRDQCIQYFSNRICSRLEILFVAEEYGILVGYIHGSVRTIPPIFQVQTIGHLNSAYVLQTYQRKGVGKQLTDALLQWFQSNQIEYIEVSSDINNPLGINAWKKYGFKPAMIKFRLKLPSHNART